MRDPPVSAQTSTLDRPSEAATAAARSRPRAGATVWLTGLPSAGKTTIAHALADRLVADGHRVQVLDGDEVRPHLSAGLGFSRERPGHQRRGGSAGSPSCWPRTASIVLVPVIAPYADAREAVRDDHAAAGVPFGEVYVSTSLEVAEPRREGPVRQGPARRDQRDDRRRRPVRAPVQRRARDRHRHESIWQQSVEQVDGAAGRRSPERDLS